MFDPQILPHRGHRYACHALCVVAPLAWKLGIAPLWITCDPGNRASRRTCELAGATLIEIVPPPPGNDMYEREDRFKCRYQLLPESAQHDVSRRDTTKPPAS